MKPPILVALIALAICLWIGWMEGRGWDRTNAPTLPGKQ